MLSPNPPDNENCAYIRRKVAEKGWTWNVVASTYERLAPGLDTLHEKLALYGKLVEITRAAPETEVCDALLATEDRDFHVAS